MKGIRNDSGQNFSYAHSVLQSFSYLECMRDFLNANNFNNVNMILAQQLCTTIELYKLMSMLNCGNEAFSAPIFNYYSIKVKTLPNMNKAFHQDPYHFLHYFLEVLHKENNCITCVINPLNLPDLMNQRNDEYMLRLFYQYFVNQYNSMISNYFYNVERKVLKCNQCGELYYYSVHMIIKFNIDLFREYRDGACPNMKGTNLSLDDCFKCYIGNNDKEKCPNCHNKVVSHTKIFSSTKVLILYFYREKHPFKGDIFFPQTLNIFNYYSFNRQKNLGFCPMYNLKAVISYNSNMGKYFADCKTNNMGITGWYRFMDNQVCVLTNPQQDLYNFEPQLLIYELDPSQCNNNITFRNPFLFSINNMNPINTMNNNIFPMNNQNSNLCVPQNCNLGMQSNLVRTPTGFSLKFICVPENGDQSETPLNKILAQVRSDATFEEAVNNFYIKLVKPREAIKRFLLNDNEIEPNNQSTLDSLGIDLNTTIKAIKADNFDELKLPNLF